MNACRISGKNSRVEKQVMQGGIFITGGARSGKSGFALSLAIPPRLFVATGSPHDGEMRERIRRHQAERGDGWDLLESPLLSADELLFCLSNRRYRWVVVDCLTLLVSNMVLEGWDRKTILERVREVLDVVREAEVNSVWVSSEVGMGLVPAYPLGRLYRDLLGEVNRLVAHHCSELYLMVAGTPLKVK